MKSEVDHIYSMLQRTFSKNAWHGPSVLEVLEGITAEQSQLRLPESHSIIELVAHMTSWRVFVIKKLAGDTAYTVTDTMNFPIDADWPRVLANLRESQAMLLEMVQKLDDSKLAEIVPHGSYTYPFYTLLHGIIHHDLYHTGQIALLKKLPQQGV